MKRLLFISILFTCLLSATTALADTHVFDNAAGGNLWGTAGNWQGGLGLPGAGDNVQISADCQIDADYSATSLGTLTVDAGVVLGPKAAAGTYKVTAGGATTINGTLGCATAGTFTSGANLTVALAALTVATTGVVSVGTYTSTPASATSFALTTTGAITLNGNITAGSSTYALPNTVNFSIVSTYNGALITQAPTGLFDTYPLRPTNMYVKLTAIGNIGDTVLSIDTNLTTGNNALTWVNSAAVCISESTGYEYESYTIQSVGASSITLTGGLSAAKAVGAFVILKTRNVYISDTSFSSNYNLLASAIRGNIDGYFYSSKLVCSKSTYTTAIPVFRGVFESTAILSSTTILASGSNCNMIVDGAALIGGYNQMSGQGGILALNSLFVGAYTGGAGLSSNIGAKLVKCIFAGNAADIRFASGVTMFNTKLLSTTDYTSYIYQLPSAYSYNQNHGDVTGAYRSWTDGGVVAEELVTVPPGQSRGYSLTTDSAGTYWGFFQRYLTIYPNQRITFLVYGYKTVSMATLPKAELLLQSSDPLVDSTATALSTWTMADTNSVWQSGIVTYYNSTAYPKDVVFRFSAKHTGGVVYFLPTQLLDGTVFIRRSSK